MAYGSATRANGAGGSEENAGGERHSFRFYGGSDSRGSRVVAVFDRSTVVCRRTAASPPRAGTPDFAARAALARKVHHSVPLVLIAELHLAAAIHAI